MAWSIREEVAKAFAPGQLYIMYGATEAAPRLTCLEPTKFNEMVAAIGKAIPNGQVLVADKQGRPVALYQTGEIVTRGPNIVMGHRNDPEATEEVNRNGYFYTDDLGQVDEEGYI